MENEEKLPLVGYEPKKAISWPAIFGGFITVFAFLLVLNLIGFAVGFSSIEPATEENPLSGIGTGTVIWWILSNLIALFIGAFVAARAGVSFSDKGGIIQGFLTWALYCVLSYLLVATAVGKVISGVGHMVMKTVSKAGEIIVDQNSGGIQMGSIDWQRAKSEFFSLLEDTEKKALDPDRLKSQAENVASSAEQDAMDAAKDPARIDEEVNRVFDKAEKEFAESIDALDREALVNVMVNRTDLSREEAGEVVDNYIDTYRKVKNEAEAFIEEAKEEIAIRVENTAEAIAKAAMYLSITLILGIVVSVFGGLVGVRSLRSDYKDHRGHEY